MHADATVPFRSRSVSSRPSCVSSTTPAAAARGTWVCTAGSGDGPGRSSGFPAAAAEASAASSRGTATEAVVPATRSVHPHHPEVVAGLLEV